MLAGLACLQALATRKDQEHVKPDCARIVETRTRYEQHPYVSTQVSIVEIEATSGLLLV